MIHEDKVNIKKRHAITIREKDLDIEDAKTDAPWKENEYVVEDEYVCCREMIYNILYYMTIMLALTIIFAVAFWSTGISIIFENLPFVTTIVFNALFDVGKK